MRGFTDIHHHIVYGLDDGAKTMEDALAMARAAQKDGTRCILGTTHVSPGVNRFDAGRYAEHVQKINARCRDEGVPMTLLSGSEIFYTDATCRFLSEGRIPTLAGTDYVLVEFNPDVRYDTVHEAVEGILREGYLPILAHMERYDCLASDIKRCIRLKDELDVLFQMNCSSVIGGRGFFKDRAAKRLLGEGLIDAVASDAHNVDRRPTRMRAAYKALTERFDEETAQRLMGCTDDGALWRALRSVVEKVRAEIRAASPTPENAEPAAPQPKTEAHRRRPQSMPTEE